jgi:hypothetical protein
MLLRHVFGNVHRSVVLMTSREEDGEIEHIRARLMSLEAERAKLEARLDELERPRAPLLRADRHSVLVVNVPTVTAASRTADKVALFRRLFVGRPDVFPVRWDNRKTGRSGYAPACANEWAKGICGKPQVKCGECPNQAFIPISDDVIEKHLRGGDNPAIIRRRLRRRRLSAAAGRDVLVLGRRFR